MTKKSTFKISFCAALLLISAVLCSCASVVVGENTMIIHYYRFNGDYSGWNVWVWPTEPNGNGAGHKFGERGAGGFVTAFVELNSGVQEVGYIIRRSAGGNDWAEKDTNDDHFTRAREIWVIQGDSAIYTARPDIGKPPVQFAFADSPDTVFATLPAKPRNYNSFSVYQDGKKLEGTSIQGGNKQSIIISLKEPIIDPSKGIILRDESGKFADKEVVMRRILDNYYYDGDDLGLTFKAGTNTFRVWAPTAESVSVALYDDAGKYNSAGKVTENETDTLYPMSRDLATGVWSAAIPGNLDGKYYLYRVQFSGGKVNWAVDPYAKAVSANGQRCAAVDPSALNPPGWKPSQKPAFSGLAQDAILYELHIRDFSIDEESGMVNKGKYLAFTERGTKNREGFPTGVDHLVNLGITHVHLLPGFDFASVNELTVDDPASDNPKYNWGYDPQNYDVPEGSYSSNPSDPKARILEYKQMVQALHDAGLRVVMDVVYNHTYTVSGSPFESFVPGYYYRTDDTGALTNGSGCGNEVASERPMVRKYIIDSCLYWAHEYGIDGFRFDLMAIIDRETMRQLAEKLKAEADPGIIIYGEPWMAGVSGLPSAQAMTVGAQRGTGIAIFNDRIRSSIKGGTDDASRGFATGQANMEPGIASGIRGTVDGFADRASESVNYVTCHDNLNLWDKVSLSWGAKDMKGNPYSLIDTDKKLLMNNAVRSTLLANGIILTAQGVPFFQAGDEFLRTKFGDHNSYRSPDSINAIRWVNAGKYRAVVDYYAGLIRLRKEHPAFRMDSKADMAGINFLASQDRLVAFTLGGNANGNSWTTILVAYNAGDTEKKIDLPGNGTWYQVVNEEKAGVTALAEISGSVTLPPLSMAVLHD